MGWLSPEYASRSGRDTWLKNPTLYYMAVVNIKHDGKNVTLSNKVMKDVVQCKPFSDVNLGKKMRGKYSVDAINDRGEVQNYDIH